MQQTSDYATDIRPQTASVAVQAASVAIQAASVAVQTPQNSPEARPPVQKPDFAANRKAQFKPHRKGVETREHAAIGSDRHIHEVELRSAVLAELSAIAWFGCGGPAEIGKIGWLGRPSFAGLAVLAESGLCQRLVDRLVRW